MSIFTCCLKISHDRAVRKSLKKSIQEYHDTKTLASFTNISFKSGTFRIPRFILSRKQDLAFVLDILLMLFGFVQIAADEDT